jgi:hypothetical protein
MDRPPVAVANGYPIANELTHSLKLAYTALA